MLAHLHLHLFSSVNFSEFQSMYLKGQSTETALLEVLDRVYTAARRQFSSILTYPQLLILRIGQDR